MKNKILYIIIVLFAFHFDSFAQQVTIKADSLAAAPGDSVTISIYFTNFNYTGAVTLYLAYNSGELNWGRGTNWLDAFNNGFNYANAATGLIAISCLNYYGVTAASGKLLDLRFKYYGGGSNFIFQNNCEIADADGLLMQPNPVYQNGWIVQKLRVSLNAYPPILCAGNTSQIHTNTTGIFGSYTYQWSSVPAGFSSSEADISVSPMVTTRYYVTASDDGYSDTSSILIQVNNPPLPAAVTSMFPLDNSSDLHSPVSLSWNPASNATLYDIYVWNSNATEPSNPSIANVSLYNASINITQGQTYKWQVISKNSCFQAQGPVYSFSIMALPDLHVTQISNSLPMAGQPITISWTVKNDGLGPTIPSTWYDRLYVSPDIELRIGEPEHVLLGVFPNLSYLGPGESYTQTQTVTLPVNLVGTHYLFALADIVDAALISFNGQPPIPYNPPPYFTSVNHGGSLVPEVNDNDNFFYKEINLAIPPLPDLIVTNISKPGSVFSGQALSVSWTVKNQGQAITNNNTWSDRIYLSKDTVLNPATAKTMGTFTHTGNLKPDSLYFNLGTFVIPNFIFGKYYIYVQTDIFNQVFEHAFKGNNITRSDSLIIYLTPPPDLVPTNLTVPAVASTREFIDVKYLVMNQGPTATISKYWYDRFYLSQSPTGDLTHAIQIGSWLHHGILNAFDTYPVETSAQIPTGITGFWYLYVKVDADSSVFEYPDKNNNLLRSDTTLQVLNPDLEVTSITMPASDITDAPFTIGWVEMNNGPGSLFSSTWLDKFYLSVNAIWDSTSAIPLDSIQKNNWIYQGDSIALQQNCILPNINSGDYYLYVYTDRRNQVYENDAENNNVTRSQTPMQVRMADLVVSSLSTPSTAQSGLPVDFAAVIRNNGPGSVANKLVKDKVFLSITPVYSPVTAIFLGYHSNNLSMGPGDSTLIQLSMDVPNGISGPYYLIYYTDFTNIVREGIYENNNIRVSDIPIMISNGPYADLKPTVFNLDTVITAGFPFNVSFTIRNIGTKTASYISWLDKIYFSTTNSLDLNSAKLLLSSTHTGGLEPDISYSVNTLSALSPTLSPGTYYFYLFTDATDSVFEFNSKANNVYGPVIVHVNPYPVDLKVTFATTAISSIMSGQSMPVNYTVKNVGTAITLVNNWDDAMYLSQDTTFNFNQARLLMHWTQWGPVIPGASFSSSQTITIPNGVSGIYHLFVVEDRYNNNHDINPSNNIRILRDGQGNILNLLVTLTPPPDLVVTSLIAPSQVNSGQAFYVKYGVKNQGTGPASPGWMERFYLSTGFLVSGGDQLIGTHHFNGILYPDSSYSDSASLTAYANASGNFNLIMMTNSDNSVYESNTTNNTLNSFIIVAVAPPGDLVVTDINSNTNATIGGSLQFTWKIRNNGPNPLTGQLKDAIYLSTDTLTNLNDVLWSTFSDYVSIPQNGEQNRSMNLKVPGLAPGNYYIKIRTNILNTLSETDRNNNTGHSSAPINLDFKNLILNVLTYDTLINQQNLFYKLIIPDSLSGETFLLTLKGDSVHAVNQVFASFGTVPTNIIYDYNNSFPFKGNQELVIPTLQSGTYYFLFTGNITPQHPQPITIIGKILQFEIRSLDKNQGGNTASITVKVIGSKFIPGMDLFLFRDTSVVIEASFVQYVNASLVYASFNLAAVSSIEDTTQFPTVQGEPLGFYDVRCVKPDGAQAVLHNGFEIVPGLSPPLLTNIQYPAMVRPNRFFTMSVQFANAGNVDVPIPHRFVMSIYGAPIAFKSEDLKLNLHDLYLEFKEPGGTQDVLRPGAVSEIVIHCKSSKRLVFRLIE